jgi:hypothetical protein
MSERLDPWQNIVGVGWREDQSDDTWEYPLPEYYCEFTCGLLEGDRAGEFDRGINNAWPLDVTYRSYGEWTLNSEGYPQWFLTKEIVLVGAAEGVNTRGDFAGIAPASWWQFLFARPGDEPGTYSGHPTLRDELDGKYLIHNGKFNPLIPQLYKDGPSRDYGPFSPTGLPNYPETHGPAKYGPISSFSSLFTPNYYYAGGDMDPPGGKVILGLEPGTVHRFWLVDSLEEDTVP